MLYFTQINRLKCGDGWIYSYRCCIRCFMQNSNPRMWSNSLNSWDKIYIKNYDCRNYFSTYIIPLVTIVTEHKTQLYTFPKKTKKNIMLDYFKGLLMTHHWDIFMSGKKIGFKRVANSLYQTAIKSLIEPES